ncbi:MAG: nucleotide exchange factor GrpE [Pseudomonadota bacterium]
MIDNDKPHDEAVAEELEGVPEHLLDDGEPDDGEADGAQGLVSEALSNLKDDLQAAEQATLYAQAETQNLRRRMEKELADTRKYAATSFARDVLSVWDNLSRAVDAIPESLRDDEKMKGLVVGIEATQRELEKVFKNHGIERIAAVGIPLDPNQHQAMIEISTADEEPGTVVQEMQSGWMIKDRLLRAAMVGVAKAPE